MLKIATHQTFSELSVVRLKANLFLDGHLYRAGTAGTVVFVHGNHEAYEVELFEPAPAVATMRPSDLTQ